MSYETACNDYALYGNPMQDAMDYEENAHYDQHDGLRGDLLHDYNDGDLYNDCGIDPICAAWADFEFESELFYDALSRDLSELFNPVPF